MLLTIAVAALLIGPLLAVLLVRQPGVNRFLDGFVLISIGGIAITHLLPEAVVQIGFAAVLMVILGALLPYFAEKAFHSYERATHAGVLLLALSGILVHTLLDGMALSTASRGQGVGQALAVAVILHRLPVGLLIWWALKPFSKPATIVGVLVLMSISTIIGFILGGGSLPLEDTRAINYFQSLVTGSLLHVLFHRHIHKRGETEAQHGRKSSAVPAALGAISGGLLLILLPLGGDLPHDHSIESTLHLTYRLFLKSAPALLLGFVIAASIQNFIPEAGINWLQSRRRSGRVMKGMLFGLPLPICSCGVVPLYHSLIKRGVPVGAAMAFLIATPELGIDAILISVPLLGLKMTLVRLVAAALIALATGYIMDWLMPEKSSVELPVIDTAELPGPESKWMRFWKTLNYELIDDLGPWVLFGLMIAAIADPFLGKFDWGSLPMGVDVLIMALVGMPLYVCATGATPIAAVMLLNGVSPGAVLAFLITGPATNITTLGVMKNLHGKRTAIIFPVVIIGLTIIVGLIVDMLLGSGISIDPATHLHDDHSLLNYGAAMILGVLFIGSLFRIGPRGMLENLYEGLGDPEAEEDDHHGH